MFPDYNASLEAQQMLAKERSKVIPAADFLDILVIFVQMKNSTKCKKQK